MIGMYVIGLIAQVFFSARIDQTSTALITVTFGFPFFSSCISF